MSYRRPAHRASGGPHDRCAKCGLFGIQHDERRRAYVAQKNRENPTPPVRARIIGIDGEGQGRAPHLYNFLAAADEFGATWSVGDNPDRQLTTRECFDFLLSLPQRALVFGYAFSYDLTKILTDLPDRLIYLLMRPDERRYLDKRGKVQHRPIKWEGYKLNYLHRRFTLSRGTRRVTVWDIFAFYQSRFTKALADWKTAPAEIIARMERMKERRSSFDAQSFEEIQRYCLSEVRYLAKLGRQLLDAHERAEIPLKTFYGAGSTGGALLKKHEVSQYIGEIPEAMKEAVACAFFGGRFENSVIGTIDRPVWNYDISSAYPYAQCQLPCLIHGKWKRCHRNHESEIERAQLALINWTLPRQDPDLPWGPLPVRTAKGTIVFPLSATSGWCWKAEFLAARQLAPRLAIADVWTYQTQCNCKPFAFLPDVYLERLKIGKEGPGLVLKLGANSGYGKIVQSVGIAPPFQSFVWGGNITSNTRAQCLDAILRAPSPANVLMIATDGVWADCELDLPKPVDTGTDLEVTDRSTGEKVRKPLGGWEMKHFPGGMFAARPGIYFPLGKRTEEVIEKFRARGLGRRTLYDNADAIIAAYENGDQLTNSKGRPIGPGCRIEGGQRFIGAKSGVSWTKKGGAKRDSHYGDWIDWGINVSFDPKPKRREIRGDNTLVCHERFNPPTTPYKKALKDPEVEMMLLAALIAEEQPNADYVEV